MGVFIVKESEVVIRFIAKFDGSCTNEVLSFDSKKCWDSIFTFSENLSILAATRTVKISKGDIISYLSYYQLAVTMLTLDNYHRFKHSPMPSVNLSHNPGLSRKSPPSLQLHLCPSMPEVSARFFCLSCIRFLNYQ